MLDWRAKGTMGAHQGGEEAESEDKEERECLGRIFSFYYSILTEMMSAPNEFPQQGAAAVKGGKTKVALMSACPLLQAADKWSFCCINGHSAGLKGLKQIRKKRHVGVIWVSS